MHEFYYDNYYHNNPNLFDLQNNQIFVYSIPNLQINFTV